MPTGNESTERKKMRLFPRISSRVPFQEISPLSSFQAICTWPNFLLTKAGSPDLLVLEPSWRLQSPSSPHRIQQPVIRSITPWRAKKRSVRPSPVPRLGEVGGELRGLAAQPDVEAKSVQLQGTRGATAGHPGVALESGRSCGCGVGYLVEVG